MAPSVLGLFSRAETGSPPKEPIKEKLVTTRALPGPWYTSQKMYELERRAIFSRRWLLITHQSRFDQAGDFIRYSQAGYDFVINKDRQGNIRAFHNVCRHRAYPVVEQEQGQAKIFACKYHGWSYGLDGKLAKAPNYQDIDGFDKSRNGLLSIHTHVDSKGFIWVNLDSKATPEVPWEEHFAAVDEQERFDQFNFDDYVYDHQYELDGSFNWKILADNFNECYHCKTTHPDVPTFLTIGAHEVDTKDGHMQHDHASTPEQREKGFNINSTYYFPNVSMSIAPSWMMIQKFMPTGPSHSRMHYEIYRNKKAPQEQFELIDATYKRVMAEDKVLCNRAQDNLNAGVFLNGELHPRWEKGPLFFQQSARTILTEHYRREKAAGHEIWPARQVLPADAEVSREDMEMCNGLSCSETLDNLTW